MKRYILPISLLWAVGCADTSIETQPAGPDTKVERAALEGDEVFYVHNASDVVELNASKPFEFVEFHVSLGGAEFRAFNGTEVIVDWSDVSTFTEDSNPASHEGTLVLPEPATHLEFRPNTSIEFARFLVGEGHGHHHEGEIEIPEGAFLPLAALPGRWIPPAEVVEIANGQTNSYTGAPSACSGTFLPGTREVADFLRANFGASSYGGYACRANTANTSQLSVHASGRAIDLFVPLDGGEADNELGDPIAHYLMTNAVELGIEFIVWDRTSWGSHRAAPKHRAYTGPHPHHDHLHIELSPGSANTTGRTFPSIIRDESPVGYVDAVNCEGIAGWAHDPDEPAAPIEVYISIGGPVFTEGAAGYWATASRTREDLQAAIGSTDHGYQIPIPRGLMDGQAREVYVYGQDITGGQNSELIGAGKVLQCDPPALPFDPSYAVRRHISSGEVLDAWGFDRNNIAPADDNQLLAYEELSPIPAAPTLMRQDGDAAVYLVEGDIKRHVPNPEALAAWHFDPAKIQASPTDDLATGEPLQQRPYLARGSGPEVYLITPPPPNWAVDYAWNAPPKIGLGQTATIALEATNRGSNLWEKALGELRPVSGSLVSDARHGERVAFTFDYPAPATTGIHEVCVEVFHDGYKFAEQPACMTIEVVEEAVDLQDLTPPNPIANGGSSDPGSFPTAIAGTSGGCSSTSADVSGSGLILGLFGLILFGRRRRR